MNSGLTETRSQDIKLNALLEGIEAGQVVLPNFQRDFDWTDADIRSLLGTVLSGWPMGALLLIEGDKHNEFYAPRPVTEAPPVADPIAYIILDGQQRLTSLYHALMGRGDDVYALKLDPSRDYSDVDVIDELIVTIRGDVWSAPSLWDERFIPFTALRTPSAFYQWRDEAGLDPEFSLWVTQTYRDHLSKVDQYRLPAVIVDSGIAPAGVARVFERVNRAGMKLGAFDLVVAKSYSPDFNLRSSWEQAQIDFPILETMLGDDGLPVLAAIALRQKGDVRQSAVLDLSKSEVATHWGAAAQHYATAAQFVADEFGVRTSDWLPYKQVLTVLAALDFVHPLTTIRAELARWFWSTGFGKRYDAASNTRAVADYRELVALKDPIKVPLSIVRESALEATRGQQGAWHRSYLCAIATSARNDNAAEELTARSVFARGTGDMDPPLHLRTLTFALWQPSTRQPLPGLSANQDMEPDTAGLEEQLRKLRAFLSDAVGYSVQIVSTEEESVRQSLLRDMS